MNGCIYKTTDNLCKRFSDEKYTSWCDQSCPYAKPSNADHIRAMTDEELAEFLETNEWGHIPRSAKGWLDWLRQEADEIGIHALYAMVREMRGEDKR